MAGERDINVRLTVRDDGTVVLKRFGRQVGRTADRSERSLGRMRRASQATSRGVRDLALSFGLLGGAAGVAAFILPITQAVRVTNQLDVALAGVRAVSQATADQMAELEAQARSLGASTQFSASQAAEAQEFLARAGFKVNEILAATPATLNLAAAGSLDLARAADISSNVLSAFQREAGDLNEIVDIMAATTSRANTNVEQMGSAMEFVAPVAESMNVSIQETAAGIAILSNAGLQGQKAGTGLRRVITELAAPSDKLKAAMGGLSLEADGLVPVLRQLAGSSLSASDAMEIFGQRGGPAFNVLKNGATSAADFAAALEDVDGAAELIAETKLDNLSGDARKLTSALSELGIQVGRSGLIEDLRGLTQGLTELARGEGASAVARNLIPIMKELLFVVTALVAARFGAPALNALGRSAFASAGTINLLSTQLATARGRFVLAGRAARAFGGIIGALGGPAGLFILAALGAYRLITAESDLEKASKAAEKAQKRLNDQLERTEKASQDAVLAAANAQRELVRQLERNVAIQAATARMGSGTAPQDLLDWLEEARKRMADLEEQVATTHPALEAFGGVGKPLSDLLRGTTDEVLQAETAIGRLEDATKRLSEQQSNAVTDARNFAKAQQDLLQAQFEAEAPALDEDQRVAREQEVAEQIRDIQLKLHEDERQIATQTAAERLFLVDTTISNEEEAARQKLMIKRDLAQQELEIERAKFETIRNQLIGSLNEEKRLRQLSAKAAEAAAETFNQPEETDNARLIRLREEAQEAERNGAQIDELIQKWQAYNQAAEGSVLAQQKLRELSKKAADETDKQRDGTAEMAENLRGSASAAQDFEERIRDITKNIDMKTSVSVDDTEFRSFLDDLATPTEHTVHVNFVTKDGTTIQFDEQGNIQGLGTGSAGFATGGRVPGGYGGGDRVNAMLEPGEYVIRKEAVRRYGPAWMAALNGLRIRPPTIYRQSGGPVGDLGSNVKEPTRDLVDINVNVGGERASGIGDRELADGLARALKGLRSSVPGAV